MTYPDKTSPTPLSQRYRNLSLRKKLVVIISTVASFVTIVAMLVSSVIELTSFRNRLLEEYAITARITAGNLEAAVGFRDEFDSNDILSLMSERDYVTTAAVYLVSGDTLAEYRRQGLPVDAPIPSIDENTGIHDGYLIINQAINLKGSTHGYLVFKAELGEIDEFVVGRISVFAIIVLASLGAAIILAERLGGHISRPIIELAHTAERITKDHDFSTRQERNSDDETGQLIDAFNKMIAEIESRSHDLEQARDKAEASSRAKDDFLSVISHELRTPLNPIIGYVEILLQKTKEAEDRKQLGLVRQYAEHLQSLIDRVIDYSRFERGAVSMNNEPVDYQRLCQNVVGLLQQQAEEKGLTLSCIHTFSDEAIKRNSTISTDRVKLQQVVLNLVANSLKFTHSGCVNIQTHLRPCEGQDACLRIEVQDTGIGIDSEDRDRVFKPFSQIDVSLTRQYSGMGLGLAITQKIVDAMGGKLDFESKKAVGSMFWFEIPVSFTDEIDPDPTIVEKVNNDKPAAPSKVLLVDDQLVNLELGESMLTSSGHEVVCAQSGIEAVELVQKEEFDLVILDIKMPKMNGYETAREMRKLESNGKRTPIIAMTAHVTSRGNEQCLEAGMDDSMSKPFNTERLNQIISKWLA